MIKHHPRAGQLAHQSDLINVSKLISQFYALRPEPGNITHIIKFGTSGHRGSSKHYSFNELHIWAISQAIVEERTKQGIIGPCYVGKDTHALSEPAFISVIEVLTANRIEVIIQTDNGYTPTPVISNAILTYNRFKQTNIADGIIITSSHNPPEYGGIKYNLPNGGPANTYITQLIEQRSNALLKDNLHGVKRLTLSQAWRSGYIHPTDFIQPYIKGLTSVVDMPSIQHSQLKLGVDPLGGSGIAYWQRIAEHYQLDLTILNDKIDQTFRFMRLDDDGIIRMDCSSKSAVAGILELRHKFNLIFTNDPDHDRHGIITPSGLMHPNHYMATAINYLFQHRPCWDKKTSVGKTIVSSTIIDQVTINLNRNKIEVPVGFKWFVNGLYNSSIGFGGEESAGASFLCFNRQPWSTDKDGIILCLLAAEITAVTNKNPQQHYNELIQRFGTFNYNRIQIPANQVQKKLLSKLSPEQININILGGDPINTYLVTTPKNNIPINGLKVITRNGWFAVRPSGTEELYKIYCESFLDVKHRRQIEKEARDTINHILKNAT